ncbi:hypothetical protein A8V33_01405 [Rickettsia sp. wb]|nr:hypothetical protein A8V34_00095 [Rickettsia sp. wq]ODA37842.1 hypothetical protein A8V33_01405 [Rickettsia sp. wb]
MHKLSLTILTIILIMPNITKAQVTNMIEPVSYFVNHVRQLNMLKDILNEYRKASLVGISGIGKTQIARMYVHENKDSYDIIWFVDCNLDINEELLKLAKAINKDAGTALIIEDAGTVKNEILAYLASKKKWLLIFDNLKINTNNKVEEFVTLEHNGHIMFCSQDSHLVPHIIKVDSFSKVDTETLIKHMMARPDQRLADFLMEEFKCYPVLIVQGVQLINHVPGLSQEEYKKKIHQSKDKINANIQLAINQLSPSSRMLINRIALINNQAFSKEFLRIITDNKETLDDDLYQLTKFALITNIDAGNNPVFEMHDIVANEIMDINGRNNKRILEKILSNIVDHIPTVGKHTAYIFYNGKTIFDNLRIIAGYEKVYPISVEKLLPLNLLLMQNYVNRSEYYKAEQLFTWFNDNYQNGDVKLSTMDNDTMLSYARYLSINGGYCKTRLADWRKALEYYLRAKEVFNKIKQHPNIKCNLFYNIANSYIALGRIEEAQNVLKVIAESNEFSDEVRGKESRIIKSKLYYTIGDQELALTESNKEIKQVLQSGIKHNDIYLTHNYLLRAEILNTLGRYEEAKKQLEELHAIRVAVTVPNHEIFGRIFTQMSRAELGLGKVQEALDYSEKAIKIFIDDTSRPNKNIATSYDTELAKAFVAKGDALSALGQNQHAIREYLNAELLYWNNYQDNIKNIDEVSRLYLAAVKCGCNMENKSMYKRFHDQHLRYFGSEHPRSIEILKMDQVCIPKP